MHQRRLKIQLSSRRMTLHLENKSASISARFVLVYGLKLAGLVMSFPGAAVFAATLAPGVQERLTIQPSRSCSPNPSPIR